MNCQLCKELSDAFTEDKLTSETKAQVEAHLRECKECRELYRILMLAEMVIKQEKETVTNHFLATRVMAVIENSEAGSSSQVPLLKRVLRPILITTALAAAVFYGIIIGSIYPKSGTVLPIPVELALINDTNLESVNLLSNE